MKENGFLNRIKKVVNENISNENFGVSELASEIGLSRSQTLRKIKALTGKSANHFIRDIRLEQAILLLQEENYTASEIAYKVGFSSPSYFNKCFHDTYGITPGDYKKHNDTELISLPKKPKYSTFSKIVTSLLLIFIVLAIATTIISKSSSTNDKINTKTQEASIAVLPLLDLSKNKDMQYMAVGLTDAITLELSKLKGLRVISRGSTMLFKDSVAPYSTIAKKLNVDLLLEGSIIYSPDSLRVTVQLIEPFPKEKHVWANKYDQNTSNFLQLADDISTQIAKEINLVVSPVTKENSSTKVNPKAFELYLKGKYLWRKQDPESVSKAISYLKNSIEMDSGYAPTYSALAECYIIMNKFIRNNQEKLKNRQDSRIAINNALNKAISLDGSLAEAYITKGNILGKFDWNWEGMRAMAEKGLRLNPNNSYGHILLSNYWAIKGDYNKSIEEAEKAETLDPLNPSTGSLVSDIYVLTGDYNKAIEKYNQVLELFPHYGFAWNGIGITYYLKGEKEKAKDSWKKLHNIMGNYAMADYYDNKDFNSSLNHWISEATGGSELYCSNPSIIAMAHLFVDKKEGALDFLELAYKYKNEDLPLIMLNPVFKNLHNEPRFKTIANKLDITLKP